MGLSVVIPIYNEKDNIRPLARLITEAVNSQNITEWEALFVNDGSHDGSGEILDDLAKGDASFKHIRLDRNHGQTAALDAGFRQAVHPLILTMDGDLQNDPRDLAQLLKAMTDETGCVCGVRVQRRDNWLRRISSKIANGVRNRLSGEQITDTGCSLKLFRKACLERIKLFEGMHRFLPTLCKLEGYLVAEVPVGHHPRRFGTSKYGVWNRVFRSFRDLLAVRWMKSRQLRYKIVDQKRSSLDHVA